MSIINIRPAVRAGSKVVIGIAGTSGSGKTYTALKLARGMVDHPSEIGFLDTENRRGSLYADILDGPFMIGDLYAPFSPDRYAQAIKAFQDSGVKVLVVDSASHEHEGEGGLEDHAHRPTASGQERKIADWQGAKREHKKFMRALLQSDMHIIVTLRAREKMDFSNPKQPKSLGIQPICEKNFMFEMTASMMMFNEGHNQQFLKMPEALRAIFGNGAGYLGESHGSALVEWVNSGEKIDEELESWKNRLQMSCDGGTKSLQDTFSKAPARVKNLVKSSGFLEQLKATASAYDNVNQGVAPEAGMATEKQVKDIQFACEMVGRTEQQVIAMSTGRPVSSISQLTEKEAATAIANLKEIADNAAQQQQGEEF
ncbi:P-loop containing nucleoside triphosphate hydrolase [Vibrio phage 1.123.O._10N.286.48.F3]|nr:P-loop containing nucleoside triphosphate hydrolase [Vibrio phage 1.123.O._10N.286.48.F3]